MFQELEQEGLEPFSIPNLWLGSNEPDTYVDITDTIDLKIQALAQHVSEEGEAAAPFVRERADRRARRRASSTPKPSRPSGSATTTRKASSPWSTRTAGTRAPSS